MAIEPDNTVQTQTAQNRPPLLSIRNLSICFSNPEGPIRAVQNVSLSIDRGESFALVGESGCGKSTVALSIMRLLPKTSGSLVGGHIFFQSEDILTFREKQMQHIRGRKIGIIFQNPATSLNPTQRIGVQLIEALRLVRRYRPHQARQEAVSRLSQMGLDNPERVAQSYSHQLSGGMQQRVMIAMATSAPPALLIADEPTSSLDVTLRADSLDLLDQLQQKHNMSILLITHDLEHVARRADRIGVMYASRIVEISNTPSFFAGPRHPYSQALLACTPTMRFEAKRLPTIDGPVPETRCMPTGCKFHPRCPIGRSDRLCQNQEPELQALGSGRLVACWHPIGPKVNSQQ